MKRFHRIRTLFWQNGLESASFFGNSTVPTGTLRPRCALGSLPRFPAPSLSSLLWLSVSHLCAQPLD